MLEQALIDKIASRAGPQCAGEKTDISRLEIWSGVRTTGSEPSLFASKFYVVLQGAKRMNIANGTYDLNPGDCAVSIVGLPFRYEVLTASRSAPYLGVGFTLDPIAISSLLRQLPEKPNSDAPAFAVAKADANIRESIRRLLQLAFNSPDDIPVLAPLAEQELLYHLLQSPFGGTVRRLVEGQSHIAAIRRAVEHICTNPLSTISVADLATTIGMSVTSFHRHFKSVTGYSPLSYQRHIRLLDAQRRLYAGIPVSTVSFAVGYQSPSQFSREYKHMFGVSPKHHRSSSAA